jgi:glycosyltransferase 2 family protein
MPLSDVILIDMPASQKVVKKLEKKKQLPTPPKPELLEDVEPEPRSWYHAGYSLLFAAALVVLLVSAYLAHKHTLTGWEATLFYKINHWQAPHWVVSQIAKPLSNAVWGMIGIACLALLIPKVTARAWRYVVPAVGAYSAEFIVGHVVNRPRPAGFTDAPNMVHDVVLRANQGGVGFPSGHVAVVTALGLTLWPFVSWPWRVVIGLLIIAEAWSRIFLGVHAPLDVVGGFVIGVMAVSFIRLLPHKLLVWLRLD